MQAFSLSLSLLAIRLMASQGPVTRRLHISPASCRCFMLLLHATGNKEVTVYTIHID